MLKSCFPFSARSFRAFGYRFGLIVALFLAVNPHAICAPVGTTTSIAASASSVSPGTVVTVTAFVLSGNSPVTVGQVNLCDASAAHCSDIHILGTAQLTSAGTAIFRITPSFGAHSYEAVFQGTSSASASTSATKSVTVSAGSSPTNTGIRASSNNLTGPPGIYTVTAAVTGLGSSGSVPTGSLQIVDTSSNNAVLGTAALSSTNETFSGTSCAPTSFAADVVTAADVNNDGHADLIAIDGSGNLNVALGHGDCTFRTLPAVALTVAPYVNVIVTGDFNSDGNIDLAIPNSATGDGNTGNGLVILLGNGDGTFTVSSSPPTGNFPASVVSGDFNRDGKLDLAVASDQSSDVNILLGNGDGTFTAASSVTTASGPGSVVTGDFNGDGILDLAVLTYTDYTVSIYLGEGDGTFNAVSTPALVGFDLESLAVADLNGDGVADLLVAGVLSPPTSLLGNGDGTFSAVPSTTTEVASEGNLVVADFNGDGKPDLVAVNSNSNSATGPIIYLGNGDGTFTMESPLAGLYSESLAVADFNGDGRPDVVQVNGYETAYQQLVVLLIASGPTATATASSISVNSSGIHHVVAVYSGDTNYSASTSASIDLISGSVTPTLIISAGSNPTPYGQSVLLTATLTPYTESGISSDGESVSFYNGTTLLGTGVLRNGAALLYVNSFSVGSNSISASYAGDSFLNPATSNTLSLVTVKSTPTITWTPPSIITYNGKPLGSILNATASVGGSITYSLISAAGSSAAITNASILSAGTYALIASFTPTDQVDYNTTSVSSSFAVSGAPLAIVPSDATRVFGGANPVFSATVGGALNGDIFTVTGTSTATTASPVGKYPIAYTVSGANLTNYVVTYATGALTVTPAPLTVTASNAARVFGTANPAFAGTITGALSGSNLVESFTTTATSGSPVGTYPIVPSVTGADASNYTATATNGTLTVTQAGTATSLAISGQNLVLSATVVSATSGTPTGTAGFYSGQTLLGTGALSNGVASFTQTAQPLAGALLSAQYSGDGNFIASSSTPVALLAVGPSAAALSVPQNGSVTDSIHLSVASGYTGTVQFSCTGLPANSTCSFQPASATFSGQTTTASTSLTLQTGVSQVASAGVSMRPGRYSFLLVFLFTPCLIMLGVTGRRGVGTKRFLITALLCLAAFASQGCGGASNSTSTATTSTATPTGTSNFQVVATGPGGLSQSISIALNVQ